MSRRTAVVIAALAVAAGVLPLLRGFPEGHDWLYELVRVAEFRHALIDGQLPPFRAPNLYAGMGSPIFLFYAPLFAATAAAFSLVTGSIAAASSAALITFSIVGACLMWRFVREVCPDQPHCAAVAVSLVALHPYLLGDKWARNANAEFAALSLLPAILLGATVGSSRRAFWWTATGMAAVTLAHNIVALVAASISIAFALFVHRSIERVKPVVAGLVSGIAVSTFFWLPAIVLQPLVRTEDLLRGKFDFHGHFPPFVSLFGWRAFYAGGVLTLLVLLFIAFRRIADERSRRVVRACAISCGVFLFLMLPFSTPLWETLPLLKFTQFPWRFMGPLAVMLAAGAGIATRDLAFPRAAVFAVLLGALLNAGPMLLEYRPIGSEPLLTPATIREYNLRATVLDEYLPRQRNVLLEEPRVRSLGKAISATALAALLAAALVQRRRVKTAA